MNSQLGGLSGIITGAGSGIGAGLMAAFENAGAIVEGWDVVDGDGLVACDVADPASVARATVGAVERLGRIDFLVNNAGVRAQRPFLEASFEEEWQRVIDVDLTGVWNCSQAVGRVMVAAGGGKVLNIASIVATHPLSGRPAYTAAKAGVAGLTRAMAVELGGRGIRCNALGPGVIETPLTQGYFDDAERAGLIREGTPLGRWGKVDDLCGPAIFLCSAAADFVSGQLLMVDGGWTAGKHY